MPVPAHSLLTWKGVFGSAVAPIEEWQFSLKSSSTLLVSEEYNVLAAALGSCYVENILPRMPTDVVCTSTEYAEVASTGLYAQTAGGAYRRGTSTFVAPGTASGGAILPLQTALTISLTTGRAGPTGKGRFYLPFPGVVLDAGHRLPDAYMGPMATAMAEFIRDVNTAVPSVVVGSSYGYLTPVTGVRVGRVPDTQRRRRGDLIEAYASAVV